MTIRTLRPGILVVLKTGVEGGVSYEKEVLQSETLMADGAKEAEWKTKKRVDDAEEHDRAEKRRAEVRSLIEGACAKSDFGLLCPSEREQELGLRIAKAQILVDEFNKSARASQVVFRILRGRVEQDDALATKALAGEVAGLMRRMEEGIAKLDVKAIRRAASEARSVSQMLSNEAQATVVAAIVQARDAAREIASRVEKAGELAATVLQDVRTEQIKSVRLSMLDVERGTEVTLKPVARALDVPASDAPDAPKRPSLRVVETFSIDSYRKEGA